MRTPQAQLLSFGGGIGIPCWFIAIQCAPTLCQAPGTPQGTTQDPAAGEQCEVGVTLGGVRLLEPMLLAVSAEPLPSGPLQPVGDSSRRGMWVEGGAAGGRGRSSASRQFPLHCLNETQGTCELLTAIH